MSQQAFLSKYWIYNLNDYRQIFGLTDEELHKTVLDYPGGISSVNAELYAQGFKIVSASPSYRLAFKEMQERAKEILQKKIVYLHQHLEMLSNPTPEVVNEVIGRWQISAEQFLADYERGKKQGRYLPLEGPPFTDLTQKFELLLCTDFLFNQSHETPLSAQEIMNELCKLSSEIRIFPLPDAKTPVAAELGPIMLLFQQSNFGVEVRAVNYQLRTDANAFLRIWAKECKVTSE